MTVNIEIKGNLARLLATEDLMVEHKNVETASFNVESRILTLPQWKTCLLYTTPSPRDLSSSRMPSSA